MLFNSLAFLVFAPLFLLAYFASSSRTRLRVCLAASYLFYGWWDWRFLALIVFITLVNYTAGRAISNARSPADRRSWLVLSVTASIGVLGVCKYFDFFVESLNTALRWIDVDTNLSTLNLLLPVGISFYTFQALSYTIDLYRQRIEVEDDLLRFSTFVAFFPQLVAGPIVRASHFLPQLKTPRRFAWDLCVSGCSLVLWGYFMKVAVADSLAPFVDSRFAEPHAHSSLSLALGVVFYAFQIYCDFAGYSNIAIGIGRILGFDFGVNFARPYFSGSFSEFWSRWHISLSSWFRDYVYVPLGGGRGSSARTLRNLMLTMLLGGLWHGASWTFVAWGALHGIYLIAQRLVGGAYRRVVRATAIPPPVSRIFCVATVFLLTCISWILFRASSMAEALEILGRIGRLEDLSFQSVPHKFHLVKGLALIALVCCIEVVSLRVDLASRLREKPLVGIPCAAALLWLIALAGTFSEKPFLYFQF